MKYPVNIIHSLNFELIFWVKVLSPYYTLVLLSSFDFSVITSSKGVLGNREIGDVVDREIGDVVDKCTDKISAPK